MCIFLGAGTLYILSYEYCYICYAYQKLNLLVCVNEFIWSFLPLSPLLVYHRYTNANIGDG